MAKATTAPTSTNKPHERLSVGPIRAAIWRNEHPNGVSFNVTFSRAYKDPDSNTWKNSTSFGVAELLALAKCANRAHSRLLILAHMEREKAAAAAAVQTSDTERKPETVVQPTPGNPATRARQSRAAKAR